MRPRVSKLVLLVLTLNCIINGVFAGELTHVYLSLALICVVTLVTKVHRNNEDSE